LLYFFFSSRRRHTRSKRDWSSDVCSSDLLCKSRRAAGRELGRIRPTRAYYQARKSNAQSQVLPWILHQLESELPSNSLIMSDKRSEERRVGKECRYRRWTYDYNEKV